MTDDDKVFPSALGHIRLAPNLTALFEKELIPLAPS